MPNELDADYVRAKSWLIRRLRRIIVILQPHPRGEIVITAVRTKPKPKES